MDVLVGVDELMMGPGMERIHAEESLCSTGWLRANRRRPGRFGSPVPALFVVVVQRQKFVEKLGGVFAARLGGAGRRLFREPGLMRSDSRCDAFGRSSFALSRALSAAAPLDLHRFERSGEAEPGHRAIGVAFSRRLVAADRFDVDVRVEVAEPLIAESLALGRAGRDRVFEDAEDSAGASRRGAARSAAAPGDLSAGFSTFSRDGHRRRRQLFGYFGRRRLCERDRGEAPCREERPVRIMTIARMRRGRVFIVPDGSGAGQRKPACSPSVMCRRCGVSCQLAFAERTDEIVLPCDGRGMATARHAFLSCACGEGKLGSLPHIECCARSPTVPQQVTG